MTGRSILRAGMLAISFAMAGLLAISPASAAYPERIITGVVPYGVGGPSDIISRLVAAGLAKEIGQTIVIDNKVGAGGNLGMSVVAHAKPDGYTLLFVSIAPMQNPATFRHMPYDPLKDLTPVAVFGASAQIVAVSAAKIQSKTLGEFIALIKANPGKYNIAGAGGQRMTMAKFLLTFDLDMQVVNYNSAGEVATALMSGEVDLLLNGLPALASGGADGKIRLLAIAAESRISSAPDLPTTKEAGFPQYVDESTTGLYAPGGTPMDIVLKLNEATNRVLTSPDLIERFRKLGYTATPKSQAEFDKFYRSEIARWKEVAIKGNVPPSDE